MREERQPIKVELAVERVMNANSNKGARIEKIPFEKGHGRILGEDIIATHPVPPFSKSPYDGFALRSSDTIYASAENPVEFLITEHIGAGSRTSSVVEEYQAVRIMTGAEIPPGADCVAMFEICESYREDGNDMMRLRTSMQPNENIIEKGSETEGGQLLVTRGKKINPGIQALLATFGYETIEVYKKPVVGIYATGSELLDVNEPLQPGKIRNSNAYMIAAQIERAGGEPRYLGKLADELSPSLKAINQALKDVDILITTGGVSVGDFDLLPEIYKELQAEVLFNKVAMRPGSVTTVALKQGKFLFGLSGNPSACYVGFELFTRPYLNTLLGKKTPYQKVVEAELEADFSKPNPFTRFVRSTMYFESGQVKIKPSGIDKSGVVTSLAETNALMVLPGGTKGYEPKDKVTAILLDSDEETGIFQIESSLDN